MPISWLLDDGQFFRISYVNENFSPIETIRNRPGFTYVDSGGIGYWDIAVDSAPLYSILQASDVYIGDSISISSNGSAPFPLKNGGEIMFRTHLVDSVFRYTVFQYSTDGGNNWITDPSNSFIPIYTDSENLDFAIVAGFSGSGTFPNNQLSDVFNEVRFIPVGYNHIYKLTYYRFLKNVTEYFMGNSSELIDTIKTSMSQFESVSNLNVEYIGEGYAITHSESSCFVANLFTPAEVSTWNPEIAPVNPYTPGGSTVPSTGPGSGTWELGTGSAAVEHSTMNSTATGLYRAYSMTLEEIQNFGAKLWSASILDTLSKHFDNPLDVVIGLFEYPFPISAGNSEEITFGWIPAWANPLDVTGSPLSQEYVDISFGTIDIPRYSGSFYDFQPYTQAQLYLPYIGFVPLKFSEIVGKSLSVNYIVSLTTGVAVAQVISSGIGVIGTYNCSIGRQLPLNSRDLSGLYMLAAKAAVAVAAGAVAIAAPAAGGALASGAGAEAAGALDTAIRMEGMGINPDPMLNQAIAFENQAITYQQEGVRISNMAKSGAKTFGQSALSGAANANAPIQRSGSLDALSGRCSKQQAFILISIPHQNMPSQYANTIGFPCNIGGVLADFQGYTEVRSIQIKATGATAQELKELESIVRGGIVI